MKIAPWTTWLLVLLLAAEAMGEGMPPPSGRLATAPFDLRSAVRSDPMLMVADFYSAESVEVNRFLLTGPMVGLGNVALAGAVVALEEVALAERRHRTHEALSELEGILTDVDLAPPFWKALEEGFTAAAADRLRHFERLRTAEPPVPFDTLDRALVYLETSLAISADFQIVFARTHLVYTERQQETPRYEATYLYFSDLRDKVPTPPKPQRRDARSKKIGRSRPDLDESILSPDAATVARWSAEGGVAYRKTVEEAASQLAEMILLDLFGTGAGERQPASVSYPLFYEPEPEPFEGTLVRATGDRRILVLGESSWVSAPARAVEVTAAP